MNLSIFPSANEAEFLLLPALKLELHPVLVCLVIRKILPMIPVLTPPPKMMSLPPPSPFLPHLIQSILISLARRSWQAKWYGSMRGRDKRIM